MTGIWLMSTQYILVPLHACAYQRVRIVSFRGGSRTAATSKMECLVIIVNGFQPLTAMTKRSILDVAAVLDPPLSFSEQFYHTY